MAIGNQLVFDVNGNVEDFIFILSTKDYRHLGAIQNVIPESVNHHGSLASGNEISFEVYKTVEKEIDDKVKEVEEPLWDEITNLKLVYVRELDTYFEMSVQIDDTTEVIKKTVTCTSLCEAELGHIYIRGLEVNSEADIARDDYEPTIFCNDENSNTSFIHRLFSFAPHYKIMHVDESLKKLQRTFSVDEAVFYDWTTGECAKEFNCLFQFDTTNRGVYVYDLCTVCKDCGHRGEYLDECPECGSTNLDYFGDDTTIYIDKENLTDAVQLATDVGAIKNCFYLEAGDDEITAIARMLNMNGSGFLFLPTDDQLAEMPEELRNKIITYNEKYLSKKDEYEGIIANIFEAQSKIDYYTHIMMPTIEHAEVTAQTEADKLTAINLSPLGLSSVTESTSKSSVESALINYAKVYVKTGYVKLDVEQSNYTFIGKGHDGYNHGKWTGNFKVTNWSDEEDIAYSEVITIDITDNYQEFLEQKIMKNVANNSDEEDSVFDVFSIDGLDDFKEALKLYGLKRLQSFYDAVQSALDVLLEVDQANEAADFYMPLYLPYYEKLQACQNEIDARQITVDTWVKTKDGYVTQKEVIQKEMNFQDYLGENLYNVFCMYRREDTYRNENYISDGLTDSEKIQKAKDFIDVAQKELEKARTPKLSISTTLYNLLIMPEFKPIIVHFKLGNWLRICVDGIIYRLRLIGYDLSFSSIQTLSVEFANVTKLNNVGYETKEILDSAKSMASNFDYFVSQAKKGNEANVEITRWLEYGLNSSLMNVKNNNNEEIVTDKHGIIARTFNDVTGNYEPEQLRITHNIIAMTEDNWLTSSLGLGKHNYTYFDGNKFVTGVGYGISSKFSQHSYIYGSQIISGDIYSENYKVDANGNVIQGSHLALKDGSFNFGAGSLAYDITNGLSVKGNITSGSIITGSKFIGGSIAIGDNFSVDESGNVIGKNSQFSNVSITNGSLNINNRFIVDTNGNVTLPSNATISWSQVTGTDGIATKAYVTSQGYETASSIKSTVITKDYIETLSVRAGSVSSNWVYAGNVKAGQIKTGIITSTDGVSTVINLDNGSFSIGKGALTWNGSTLSVSGTVTTNNITATYGNIAGWNVRTDYLGSFGSVADTVFMSQIGKNAYINALSSSKDCYIYAKGNFAVDTTGTLYATNATITGNITATTGKIGGWNIYTNGMLASAFKRSDNKYYGIALDPSEDAFLDNERVLAIGHLGSGGESSAFNAIDVTWSNANFTIRADGSVVANNLTTSNIIATGGNIGGWTVKNGYLTTYVTSSSSGRNVRLDAYGITVITGNTSTATAKRVTWQKLVDELGVDVSISGLI